MFRIYKKDDPDVTGKVVSREQILGKSWELNYKNDENYIRHMVTHYEKDNYGLGVQIIPCSKCYACRINYAAEWATRIMLESEYSQNNYWITLTYNENHVPINLDTGHNSLYPRDVTLFLKRLRKHFKNTTIKYFYCGEYGGETYRPHYHMILLNCPLDLNQFYGSFIDPRFFKEHWKSYELENLWMEKLPGSDEKTLIGMIEVTPLEWSNAAYTARYCMKKIFEEKMLYDEWEVEKEFVRMSNGIAKQYYQDNKEEIWKTDSIVMKTVKGNIGNARPPAYFMDQLKKEDPERARWILERRQKYAENKTKRLNELSNYTDVERLVIETEKIKAKAEMLPRLM